MDKDELIKSIVSDWDGDADINNMVGIDFDDDVTIPRLEDNKLIPKAVRDTYRIKKTKRKSSTWIGIFKRR